VFTDFEFLDDIATSGYYSRSTGITDLNGDGDFDLITGFSRSGVGTLFYYERAGSGFETPVLLPPIDVASTGTWLMDMAAEDFNNDGNMDLIVSGDNANVFYGESSSTFEIVAENFFASDFETGNDGWAGQITRTLLARDDTTSTSGDWSMLVFATGDNSALSIDINPSNWFLSHGSTMRFDYRIPAGTPVGMLFNVSGFGWIQLGGTASADPGTFTVSPQAVTLVDDDAWHSVEIDIYQVIRAVWPGASLVTEFQWWTNSNATSGQQFWFDDFRITRPRMVGGIDWQLLPSIGGNGRGTDAADLNNDGNMDFMHARHSSGFVYSYLGDGDGNFTPSASQVADPGNDPYGVVTADFDNDGVADVIANNGGGDPYFFAGNGDGTFQGGVYIGSLDTNNYASYGVYDFNGDGNQDVVASTYTSRQLRYYPGNGDGTFGASTLIGSTTSPAVNILSVAAPAGRVLGQPFARAAQDLLEINEGESVNFDGSESYDNGSIVGYDWDFGDGTGAGGQIVDHIFADEGNYNVVVTVTDDEGFTDRASVDVTVFGDDPVADADGPYVFDESDGINTSWKVRLDGRASSDAETSIVGYSWDFDAGDGIGVDSTTAFPFAHYGAPGVYTVTLTVTDEVGQTNTTTSTVTILTGAPPVASLSGPVVLDESAASLAAWAGNYGADASTDAEGIARYTVDWGDGTNATVVTPMSDTFNDGNYTADPAWTVSGGTWSAATGELAQTNTGAAWRWMQDRTRAYRNFQLDADVMGLETGTDGYIGIAFRNSNAAASQDSFLIYSRNSWDFWSFYDWQTATTLVDGNPGTGWDNGIWYHLRLVVVDDTMQLFVTPEGGVETLRLEVTNAAHPTGGIALLAHSQNLRYDNVKVTPLDTEWTQDGFLLNQLLHGFDGAGSYDVTLTVEDHAGQTDVSPITTVAQGNAPPVADAGGPYVLDEGDAHGSRWNFVLDASDSTDDFNIQRYTIDFGDGTSYTTGVPDGSRTGYFMNGTDLYGLDMPQADIRRVVAMEDGTVVDLINLETGAIMATQSLNRFATWNSVSPGDGTYFKLKSNKPVVAYLTDLDDHAAFLPAMNGDAVGNEFGAFFDQNDGLYIYAYEDALVKIYATNGNFVTDLTIPGGEYRPLTGQSNQLRRIVSSGRIAIQTTGNDSFTTVPSANGSPVGDLFHFATFTPGAFAVFAYDATDVEVFNMDTGASLFTRTLAAGESWFESGLATQRLTLTSSGGEVEVWAGGTQNSTAIQNLGDDISVTTGRNGTEYVLHNLGDGIVIFAPNDGTDIDIDDGALTTTLQRDGFLHLAPGDFPAGSGVHRITTTQPVVIQTLGAAGGIFDNLGTYLGGVSARHDFTATGNYTVSLTVTDNAGQTDTATTTVEVLANDPPVPVIDGPVVADEGFAVGGDWFVDFDWDFGDGTTSTELDPTHVFDEPGTYTVSLTITDHAGQQVTTTQDIDVVFGDGPNADAGGPYTFGEEAASFGVWTATLDGTGSTDDSGIFDYAWAFDANLTEDFETGLDTTKWVVSAGATVTAGRLQITGAGWGPTGFYSDATFERGAKAGDVVRFTGQVIQTSTSTVRNMWGVFKSSPASFSYTQMHHAIYFDNGTLRVYEDGSNRGAFGSYTRGLLYDVRIDVKSAGADYYFREAGTPEWILLYRSTYSSASPLRIGSAVSNGVNEFDNLSISNTLSGAVVETDFTAPGVAGVTLTVRDNALQADSESTTITIEDGEAPVADAGGPYTAEVGSFVFFNGTGSTDDNEIQTYDWTFGDTTGGPAAEGTQTADLPFKGSGPTPRHFYQQVGTYTATLEVTDNTLKSHTATSAVNVIVGPRMISVSSNIAGISMPKTIATATATSPTTSMPSACGRSMFIQRPQARLGRCLPRTLAARRWTARYGLVQARPSPAVSSV